MGNDRGKELKGKGKGREIKKAKERCKKEIRNLKRTENKTGKKNKKGNTVWNPNHITAFTNTRNSLRGFYYRQTLLLLQHNV